MKRYLCYASLLLSLGCVSSEDSPNLSATEQFYSTYNTRCIDTLVSHTGEEHPTFNKNNAFGPPKGSGKNAGSLDVFVIGEGKEAIFEITNHKVTNKSGIDIKVFENAFENSYAKGTYSFDFGTLEVSPNGKEWYGFVPTNYAPFNTQDNKNNLIGLHPVIINFDDLQMDPKKIEAGGDGFDLTNAQLIVDRSSKDPRTFTYGTPLSEPVRYFKVVDGGPYLQDGQVESNGIDIDAICAFNLE